MKHWIAALGLIGLPLAIADAPEQPPRTDLVEVSIDREFRGLWVATVSNLDFPRAQDPEQQKRELLQMVTRAKELGFNALVFQVRPEGDALYDSELEPWSRFLTGVQGQDPGYDPLAYLTRVAHAQGMEVHAWFNPYRAASSRTAERHERHVSHWAAGSAMTWGSQIWLDPGARDVQDHAVAVISDVLDRYDIDGVHMDDYFYPYPNGRQSFPDDASYEAYVNLGGTLERTDWRRSNVDSLVQSVADVVQKDHPDVRFGISPFGIYRNGTPAGTRGMDQVDAIFADPMKWYDEGWVDYLAPQLYWSTTREAQRFDRLLDWWDAEMDEERPLWVGLDCTKVGKTDEWSIDEFRTQITLSRNATKTTGQIWFRSTPVFGNQGGLADLATELYAAPAASPVIARHTVEVAIPAIDVTGDQVAIHHTHRSDIQSFVLYENTDTGWQARQTLGAETRGVALQEGEWAVSAISRTGHETLAVKVPNAQQVATL